jgi:hypothetical protein
MRRDSIVQLIAAGVLALCLMGSGVLAMRLTTSIGTHQLGYTDRAIEGDPPQVSLGIAMGAFRGLFVNFLWIRANQLKEAGRFYEAVDLSSTITKLQPRFPNVWTFHAWNLAYNISVATQTPGERWYWVQSGIRLLREQGIPANPTEILVHKELAWIYLHKVQGVMDDAHWFYKIQHAGEWTIALGPPPAPDPLSLDRGVAIKKYADWLTPIEQAPETLREAIAKEPSVGPLVERLRGELEFPILDMGFLAKYEGHRALLASREKDEMRAKMGPKNAALASAIEDPANAAAWRVLIPHVRRRVLIDEYHMEPARMIRYTQRFGPLDWRHPAAHALYWATRGSEQALPYVTQANKQDFDFVNTDRIALQSLQELFRYGEIYFDFYSFVTKKVSKPFFLAMPNVHYVQSYSEWVHELQGLGEEKIDRSEAAIRRGIAEDLGQRIFTLYSAGYENLMMTAIRYYYRRGQKEIAEKHYQDLAGWAGQNLHDSRMRLERFALPLDEFVQADLDGRAITPDVMVEEVNGSLMQAYTGGLLAGNNDLFRSQFNYARDAHKYFMERQIRAQQLDPDAARMEVVPRDFRILSGSLFARLIAVLSLDDAATMYGRAPEDLQLFAYDILEQTFRATLDHPSRPEDQRFDRLFAQPRGLEAHRAAIDAMMREQAERTSGTEQK